MTVTSTTIANRALLQAGARVQITSLTDGSIEATTCNTLFTPTFQALAQTAQWNDFRRQATLTLLAAASGTPENPDGVTLPLAPTPWAYEYQYPDDCLNFRWIVPSFPGDNSAPATTLNNAASLLLPTGGQIPYAIAIDFFASAPTVPVNVILTNQSNAIGVYTLDQPDPTYWDSLFTQAMVASLAAYLVPALSLSAPLMKLNIEVAEKIIAAAKESDGNEGVTVMDHTPDWIAARQGAALDRYGFYNGSNLYTPMSWPSYA